MSADDGIYVLINKATERYPQGEYRIALAQGIENLSYGRDSEGRPGFNSEYAESVFGEAEVFSCLNKALDKAFALLRRCQQRLSVVEGGELSYLWTPEYGIQVEDFSHCAFPELVE